MPRSVTLHLEHKETARLALERKGFLTQGKLAGNLEIALSTVSNFFNCVAISVTKFEEICHVLDLDPQVIIQPRQPVQEVSKKSFVPRLFVRSLYKENTWVGREALITELLNKLQRQTRLLWITGISGVGKTILAECLASKSQNPDVSFHRISFEIEGQSKDFTEGAAAIWAELGEKELDSQERNDPEKSSDRLFSQLQAHPYWIQLDALERLLTDDSSAEFADPFWLGFLQRCLASSQFRSRLVLTAQALPTTLTRLEDDYEQQWYEITLRGLSGEGEDSEHLTLFTRNGLTRTDSNEHILRRIGQIYEGHPLVLRVISREILADFNGNMMKYWQRHGDEFEQVARELQSQRVNPANYSQKLQNKVRHRIEASLKRLPSDSLALLCRSAVYRRPVPHTFWLAMIEDYSSFQQGRAYQVLHNRALVEREDSRQNNDIIRQHNIIRDVSYDLLKQDESTWETAERKAADQWLTAYQPAPDASNLEKVRGYLEAFYHFCEIEDWETVSDIYNCQSIVTSHTLNTQLFIWGFFKELMDMSRRLVDNITSKTKSRCLTHIGNCYRIFGGMEESVKYQNEALEFARITGDRYSESLALGDLGIVYQCLGNYEWALDFFQKALNIAQEISAFQWQASCLGNLGVVYSLMGQSEQAIDLHQQHLTISREIGARQNEGDALCNLGMINQGLGQYEQAIDYSQQHLTIAREIGDRQGEGNAYSCLGLVYSSLGQYKRAIEFFQQYLTIACEIGDRQGKGNAQGYLGLVYQTLGQYERAIDLHQQNLVIRREISDRLGEGRSLGNLGLIYKHIGQYKQAINTLRQRLAIAREIGDRLGEAIVLVNLGSTYCVLDDYSKALELQEQGLAISREIRSRQTEGYALSGSGEVYIKLEQYADARKALQNALEICKETGERLLEAEVLKNLTELHQALGETEVARQYCQKALMLATELGIPLAEECKKLKEELEERGATRGK